MAFESADERREMLADWDTCFIGGLPYPCQFDDDHIESLEISGSQPRILMVDEDVAKAGVAIDAQINHIERFTGESHTTDYKVVDLRPDFEGAVGYTLLVLRVRA